MCVSYGTRWSVAFLVVVAPLGEAPTASKKPIENSHKQPESVAFAQR